MPITCTGSLYNPSDSVYPEIHICKVQSVSRHYRNKTSPPPPRLSLCMYPLQLEAQQVGNHLTTSDASCSPQGGEVQSAGEGIGVSEEEHGRDPAASVLEREAGRVHLVLLDLAALQVVDATGGRGFIGLMRPCRSNHFVHCRNWLTLSLH